MAENNKLDKKIKELRLFGEDLERRIEELNKSFENIKEFKSKKETIKHFEDIPFDARRKIDSLTLGNIDGITKVRAYRATTDQAIPSGTATKVQLNAESYDAQNEFDSDTNYRFTAKKAGYYLCTGNARIRSLADGNYIAVLIYKNGSEVAQANISVGGSGGQSLFVSTILKLGAGDYVELYVEHNYGSDRNLAYSEHNTNLCVHQLS